MLRPHLCSSSSSHGQWVQCPLFRYRMALPSHGAAGLFSFPAGRTLTACHPRRRREFKGFRCATNEVKTVEKSTDAPVKVKGVVTVKLTVGGLLSGINLSRGLDDITDLLGKSLFLELLSADLDPKTGIQEKTIGAFLHKASREGNSQRYEGEFAVPPAFGEVGAVLVTNEHRREMFLEDVVLTGFGNGPVTIHCHSWVHAKSDNPEKRIFFANKSYLPSQTPSGLVSWRNKELKILRGDGQGERKSFERIYDYDTYNDLGDPDKDNMARPVLGGEQHPYPRRCRTGRPRTKKDPNSEKRSNDVYVPRDESFSEVKEVTFQANTVKSVLRALLPTLDEALIDPKLRFPVFTSIDTLFDDGVDLPPPDRKGLFQTALPRLVKAISEKRDNVLLFDPPALIERDKFSWFRDEEFSRQTLAGLNPLSIELVKEFPFVSKLDPEIYGPPESAITKELIEREIKGTMTVEEAIERKRLFIIDYHDLLLPYVHKVREQPGITLYGSRTVFFLTDEETLMPIAIELTRPASPTKPQWKQVFTHSWDATGAWLWRLAKAHVVAHDSGYHQLVAHWLRTHCCTEPYIIATNRQLSVMHPIHRLLRPHFRYTMEINALAREALINADGIIETCFSPGKHSIELSSVAYDKLWRFDQEGLPADLLRRGMAVEDPEAEHGLRLTIKDYPFAADGLLLWSAIQQWVEDYVSHYYPDAATVKSDYELQEWWTEIRTKGHADKQDKPGWPALDTPQDLVGIATTMIWVSSAHHAAVNFGQYHFAGYFPNRPTIARKNMPVEEDGNAGEFRRFIEKPERTLLQCFPTQIQATRVMAVLNVLSTHAPDEEYIGGLPMEIWQEMPVIKAAYERFAGRLKEIEGIIDERNQDIRLKNRCGAGIVPYELLRPFSEPGVTGMGVPNSISI